MKMKLKAIWILLWVMGIMGCGGSGGNSPAGQNDPPAALASVVVTPGSWTLPAQQVVQLTATGIYADGSKKDISKAVTWASAATGVAVVDSSGLVTAKAAGTAAITAASGSITSAPATMNVTAGTQPPTPPPTVTALAITPATDTLPAGTTLQLKATAGYSDGSNADVTAAATWTASANVQVDTNGKVTASTPGAATVTASFKGATGTAQITVTSAKLTALSLDPPQQTIAAGTGCRFTATGLFSDGSSQDVTSQATWGSSNSGIAAPAGTGFEGSFTGKSAGTVQVTATLGGVPGAATLVVTQATLVAISITPVNPTLPIGNSVTFSAVGTFSDGSTQQLTDVTWGSSKSTIASISSSGTAVALAVDNNASTGSTVISAVFGSGPQQVRGNTTLTVTDAYLRQISVTPTIQSLPAGTSLQFTATGTFSDGSSRDLTSSATWSSSAPQIAAVGNSAELAGTVSAISVGSATITATMPVNVPAQGTLVGSATVTVTPATLVSLAVTPASFDLPIATTRTVTATGTFTDGSTLDLSRMVTWTSSDPTVAAVSNASGTFGKVVPLTTGSATITATFAGKSATATVTVTPLNIVNLAGTWVGTYTIYDDPGNPSEIGTYAFKLVLGQSGSTVTASSILRGTTEGNVTLIGAVSDTRFRFVFTYISPRNDPVLMTDTALAQVVGETMTGNVVEDYILGYNCSYNFTLTRQQ